MTKKERLRLLTPPAGVVVRAVSQRHEVMFGWDEKGRFVTGARAGALAKRLEKAGG